VTYSDDSLAIMLLCTQLGLSKDSELKRLTLKEWNSLASLIHTSPLERPGNLLGMAEEDIRKKLGINNGLSVRISQLLNRGGSLAVALERYGSLGVFALTRADDGYPTRLRSRLKQPAPPVLFYAGEKMLLDQPGIAVVGSRNVDEAGQDCAILVGHACAFSGKVLFSGGARGVDSISMQAALENRGTAVGIIVHSLLKAIRSPQNRDALQRGDLCLATPYSPEAGFNVGNAMGRNKLIYACSDYAIVVASDAEKGGTWAGATENLKRGWVPLFARDSEDVPEGNRKLMEMGAIALPDPVPEPRKLWDWLSDQAAESSSVPEPPKPVQPGLF